MAAHVDAAAQIRRYDLDVGVAMRKARSPGNRPLDTRGTVRLRRTDVAPSRPRDHTSDAMLADKTGDYDLLRTLGIGPHALNVALTQRVQSTYWRASTIWRRGDCVAQLGAWARTHAGFLIELSFERQGACELTTALRWTIPVPPEARAAARAATSTASRAGR